MLNTEDMANPSDSKLAATSHAQRFVTSPATTGATLPTPVQTPSSKGQPFPTPIADACADLFTFEPLPADAPPPYTDLELELALENPPLHVTLWYGRHILHGELYYYPLLFYKLFERFMDISPSDRPRLQDPECKPWTLLNTVGQTWVDETVLDRLGVNTGQKANQEPRFIALTNKYSALLMAHHVDSNRLGSINAQGMFESDNQMRDYLPDLIIGLSSGRPLLGTRVISERIPRALMARPLDSPVPRQGQPLTRVVDLTPGPVSSAVHDAARKVYNAPQDALTLTGYPKRTWLIQNLPEHFGQRASEVFGPARPSYTPPPHPPPAATSPSPQQSSVVAGSKHVLSPSSPLWPHRGNDTIFKRSVWQQLCYMGSHRDTTVESLGGVKIPDQYVQVLFEDLQGRARVPGTNQLAEVDAKWYVKDEDADMSFLDALSAKMSGGAVGGEETQTS